MRKDRIAGIGGKLRSRAGESIAETLIALLISSVGLLMLAGMISASASLITRSRAALADYYAENNRLEARGEDPGVAKDGTLQVSILDGEGNTVETFSVDYYENDIIGSKPVGAWQISSESFP